jgi:hypothetical protein
MMDRALTVSQLNRHVKALLEKDPGLSQVLVSGEISSFKPHPSGHLYFILKDDEAQVSCVMFKGQAASLRFRPENGLKVTIRARASLFERTGGFQLYASEMATSGVGDLHLAFEQLKERLNKEGLFDPAAKKPLPVLPRRIGVITSPSGAVIRDILQVLGRRFPNFRLVLFPVPVQGPGAGSAIASAIRRMNDNDLADVLIVGRGGGSMEDLWAFNEESVARAVFASRIPVVSAVGHETDFTICDFAAECPASGRHGQTQAGACVGGTHPPGSDGNGQSTPHDGGSARTATLDCTTRPGCRCLAPPVAGVRKTGRTQPAESPGAGIWDGFQQGIRQIHPFHTPGHDRRCIVSHPVRRHFVLPCRWNRTCESEE